VQLARITNIWLIYGDMLLPTNASYARLLYELMRHAGGCETLRAAGALNSRGEARSVISLTKAVVPCLSCLTCSSAAGTVGHQPGHPMRPRARGSVHGAAGRHGHVLD